MTPAPPEKEDTKTKVPPIKQEPTETDKFPYSWYKAFFGVLPSVVLLIFIGYVFVQLLV
jgi:hypothetical protein